MVAPGGSKAAEELLSRIKPFDVWKAETNPSEEAIHAYWVIVAELFKLAYCNEGKDG